MLSLYTSLLVLYLAVATASEPTPGRVPKVYNALITSNQNLEPSKAYPVYQPVLQESAFGFPFQPVFYGSDFPTLYPGPPGLVPRGPPVQKTPEAPKEDNNPSTVDTTKGGDETPNSSPQPTGDNKEDAGPPLPPSTQSPIPLNQFGLPPAVLPLGRYDPAYDGFTQISPFYSYPGLRFYDPYDAYNLNPYPNLPPLYRTIPNFQGVGIPIGSQVPLASAPSPVSTTTGTNSESSSPPPEPRDLNLLNYSSKDSTIPNVPPPPLPQGGLKSDKSE